MNTPTGIIYAIVNTINENRYIGSSVEPETRWRIHRWHLERGDHDNIHLQRAYKKYGPESFIFEVVEGPMDSTLLQDREQYHIDSTPVVKRYNRAPLAYRPPSRKGVKLTEEHKRKIGEASKGRLQSLETRKKRSEVLKGREFSEEHRRKLRVAAMGRSPSEETREKMSLAQKGRSRTSGTLVSPTGVSVYVSNVLRFCEEYALCPSSVYELLRGDKRSLYGWTLAK